MAGRTRLGGYTVHEHGGAEAIAADAWHQLAKGRSFYLSRPWIAYIEQDRSADTSYLTVTSENSVHAVLPVYLVRHETNPDYRLDSLIEPGSQEQFLVVGTRRAYVNDLLVGHSDGDEAVRLLVQSALSRARAAGRRGVVFAYLRTVAAQALFRAWPDLHPRLIGFDTTLHLPGAEFADYLAFVGRDRAYAVRKEIKAFDRAEYDGSIERLSDCWYEAGPLVANVQQRHGLDEDTAACRASLHAQALALDDYSLAFTARRSGKLVAVALFYQWCDTLYGRLVGLDYNLIGRANEYFNLFYYQPIRYAYDHGLRSLHLGRGAYTPKLRRGAQPDPLWLVTIPDTATKGWPGANTRTLEEWQETWGAAVPGVPTEWLDAP